jgi:hypothetical protein
MFDSRTEFAYPSTVCAFARADTDDAGAPFVSALFAGAANKPNIVVPAAPGKSAAHYQTQRLYVTGPVCSKGDGELVVVHAATTTRQSGAISIFPLRVSSAIPDAEIDALIAAPEHNFDVDLSKYVDPRGARRAVCTDAAGRECVAWLHTREISVSADIANFSKDPAVVYTRAPVFFAATAANIKTSSNTAPVVEGMDDFYECENLPFDSKEDVQMYQIPVNSSLISKGTNNVAATVAMMVVVGLIFNCLVFVFSPAMYTLLQGLFYEGSKTKDVVPQPYGLPYSISARFLRGDMKPTYLGTNVVGALLSVAIIVLIIGSQLDNASTILFSVFIFSGIVSAMMGKIYYELTKPPLAAAATSA